MRLLLGDCIDKLKELDDNSIDSIVTDPPYGLSFMGKEWDKKKATQETKSQVVKGLGAGMKMTTLADNIEFEKWVTEWASECMRVLKPGGYMLAFGGSRMYHRLASGVENAGFEIRDQMMWVYGSGFPKSMDIGKGMDKRKYRVDGWGPKEFGELCRIKREEKGLSPNQVDNVVSNGRGNYRQWIEGAHSGGKGPTRLPRLDEYKRIKEFLGIPDEWDKYIEEAEREVVGKMPYTAAVNGFMPDGSDKSERKPLDVTTPATDLAKQWEGWGTALKPAHEPIVMARKPLSEKTVVDNVLEWGTGGINIDGSRIGMTEEDLQKTDRVGTIDKTKNEFFIGYGKGEYKPNPQGRFPANLIFDEEAGKILDEQTGILKSGNLNAGHKRGVGTGNSYANGGGGGIIDRNYGGDEGGASRFFYCPKTSKTDRNEGVDGNVHPTVKPTDLMLYLIRLVTPKGGTTLDPFMGSGSTGKAAVRGGFDFVGIEREEDYMEIATARIQYEIDNPYNEEKGERVEINKNSNKFW